MASAVPKPMGLRTHPASVLLHVVALAVSLNMENDMETDMHTPGPWNLDKIEHYPNSPQYRISANKKEGYLTIAKTEYDAYEDEANAQLIATAPELLEALEEAIKWFSPSYSPNCEKAYEKACAAIAKARNITGGTHD